MRERARSVHDMWESVVIDGAHNPKRFYTVSYRDMQVLVLEYKELLAEKNKLLEVIDEGIDKLTSSEMQEFWMKEMIEEFSARLLAVETERDALLVENDGLLDENERLTLKVESMIHSGAAMEVAKEREGWREDKRQGDMLPREEE